LQIGSVRRVLLRQGAVYPGEGSANPPGDVVDPLIGVPPVELAALLAR